MKYKSKGFNTKEVMDVVIAALTIKNAPRILGLLLPASVTTGLTGNVAGGAVGYLVGMLLKKPTIKNVSVALTAANIVQDIAIAPAIGFVGGQPSVSLQRNARVLSAYTSAPRSSRNYAFQYSN